MAISLGSRFGLTRWGAGTDPLRRAQLDANNALLESLAAMYGQGTIAARPAAGVAGRFWIAQGDPNVANGTLYYDTGAAWVQPLAAQQVPPGNFMPTFSTVLPAGWLWMVAGPLHNKDAYPALYAAIGDVAGVSTATQFGIPDMRGRSPFGLDAFGGAADAGRLSLANTLGLGFGSQLVTLSAAQLASHTHPGSSGFVSSDHSHTVNSHAHGGGTGGRSAQHTHGMGWQPQAVFQGGTNRTGAVGVGFDATGTSGEGQEHTHAIGAEAPGTSGISANHTHAITVSAAGSDAAHENMPPGILCNWIIKT